MHISIWTKRVVTVAIFAASASVGACTSQPHAEHAAATDVTPVNHMCPIGKEPIIKAAGTINYKGDTIGFCCPGCSTEFLAWNESDRDAWLALARKEQEPGEAR